MDKFMFEFKVLEYYADEDESHWLHGYIAAESYADACARLDQYYDVESIQLTMISDSECLIVPEEWAKVVNEHNTF